MVVDFVTSLKYDINLSQEEILSSTAEAVEESCSCVKFHICYTADNVKNA